MNIIKAIAKAEKLSGAKHRKNGQFFIVPYKGYTVEFACNGRFEPTAEATNFYTKKVGVEDDLQSDYFAGTFHDNLTQAFKFLDRYNNR